jgi:hypothetical protein
MKSSYLRAGVVALACALGLAGCGGSSGELELGGTATGVTKDTLVLQNNNGHDLTLTASGMFFFNDLIGVDEQYNVTVKSIPSNVDHCDVFGGSGRSAFNVTNVQVVCYLKVHKLGGDITGLGNASGLVLVNGTDKVAVAAGAGHFEMTPVGEDAAYGVTVLQSPPGLACTASNASGVMGQGDIETLAVNCVSAPGA